MTKIEKHKKFDALILKLAFWQDERLLGRYSVFTSATIDLNIKFYKLEIQRFLNRELKDD